VNILQPKCRIGLTGTAMDSQGYALEDAETLIGNSITASEKKGYIVPLKYYVPKWSVNVNYDGVAMSGNDYSSISLNDVLNKPEHINLVIGSMNQMDAKNKKTLVFCNSIEHCEIMTAALKEDGYEAEMIHSKLDSKRNDKVLSSFSHNEVLDTSEATLFEEEGEYQGKGVKCLLSVSKLNVGFSVKDIELGVMLRPTKVRSLWIQSCGRLIRENESKQYAEMLDLAMCTVEHGFHSNKYEAPEKGERKQLLDEKKRVAMPVVSLLANEEPTEILMEDVNLKVQELEIAKQNLESESDIGRLNYLFEASDSCYDAVRIGGVIANRFKGSPLLNDKNIHFVSDEWDLMIGSNPLHATRILKTLKTMIRNKVKNNKKIVALKFSVEWLYSINEFFVNHTKKELPVFEVKDEDIPF